MSFLAILMLAAAGRSAAAFTLELTHYRATAATPSQMAAYDSRDMATRAAAFGDNVHGRMTLTLRHGETRTVDDHFISGTLSVTDQAGMPVVRFDAMPFYSGSPMLVAPCREQLLTATRSGTRINIKSVRVDNGRC